MSDSSYRLTPSSRRVIVDRRVSSRPVQNAGQNQPKVAKKPQPRLKTAKPVAKSVKSKAPNTAVPVARKNKNIVKSTARPITTSAAKSQIPPYNPNAVKVKSVRVRKQPTARKTVVGRRTRLKPMARNILYALRLLIVGVGIGAIVGTALSVLDPATKLNSQNRQTPTSQPQAQVQPTQAPTVANILQQSQEIPGLKSAIQSLAGNNPNLTPGVFIADLDNGSYVDFNGGAMFSSASTIKLPILIAFFQDVDEGKIRLEETLRTSKATIAGGSGDMQNRPTGTEYGILEVATKMMTVSDNTATNMLIERMGGVEKLNQRFRNWGLSTTTLRNILPDIEGTNRTSPKELASLMAMITKGNIVSQESRDRIIDIMRRTVKDTLLPAGLGQGATIAHKTGEIGGFLADAGLVELASGKRYVIAVIVQRPRNDASAEKLISGISRAAYQQFTAGSAPQIPINQNNPVNPATPNNIPANPTNVGGNVGGVVPVNPIPSPVITQPLPSTNTNPIPPGGYTAPMMNPMPNSTFMTPVPGLGTNIPPTGYQAPVINPQYYYPYQQ